MIQDVHPAILDLAPLRFRTATSEMSIFTKEFQISNDFDLSGRRGAWIVQNQWKFKIPA